jgi:hypothetical protein
LPHKKGRTVGRVTTTRVVLDVFTEQDIERWSARSEDGQRYSDRVYFDLERQRAEHHEELCNALRAVDPMEVNLDSWARVTNYQWSLEPLSAAGSLRGIGGRFNIGQDLDRARNQEFPALYLAKDVDTAFCEFFGGAPETPKGKLLLQEFALRRKTSFTTFALTGRVENVFDLHDAKGLREFARIVGRFRLSPDTIRFARKVNLRPRTLIRNSRELLTRVLAAPDSWRTEPQLLGIPSANQILGRFIRDAGYEGVFYPSQQGGTSCLAVFPQNIRASGSRVEVVGAAPEGARYLVLDKDTANLDASHS